MTKNALMDEHINPTEFIKKHNLQLDFTNWIKLKGINEEMLSFDLLSDKISNYLITKKSRKIHVRITHLSTKYIKKIIELLSSYVNWVEPIEPSVINFFYTHYDNTDKLIRMFINAIYETFLTKQKTLNYKSAVLAMLDE